MSLYTVNVVNLRDYGGTAPVPMKSTDNGSAKIPHHITDDVSLVPVTSSTTALTDHFLASAVPASLRNLDAYVDQDGYLILLDASISPIGGAAIVPFKIWKVYADQHFSYTPPNPIQCQTGVVIAYTTTLFIYTSGGNHAFVSCEVVGYNGEAS